MIYALWTVGYVIVGLIAGRLSYVYWERRKPDSEMQTRLKARTREWGGRPPEELYNTTIAVWWFLLWPAFVLVLVMAYAAMATGAAFRWLVLREVHPGPGNLEDIEESKKPNVFFTGVEVYDLDGGSIPSDHPIWNRPLVSSDFEDPIEGTPRDNALIEEHRRRNS